MLKDFAYTFVRDVGVTDDDGQRVGVTRLGFGARAVRAAWGSRAWGLARGL